MATVVREIDGAREVVIEKKGSSFFMRGFNNGQHWEYEFDMGIIQNACRRELSFIPAPLDDAMEEMTPVSA